VTASLTVGEPSGLKDTSESLALSLLLGGLRVGGLFAGLSLVKQDLGLGSHESPDQGCNPRLGQIVRADLDLVLGVPSIVQVDDDRQEVVKVLAIGGFDASHGSMDTGAK
jgi:hypothetical protein